MTTRFVGHPFAADNLVGVYPTMINGRAVLVFTNSGTRQAIWTTKAPQGLTGALSSPIPTRPTQVDDMAATEQNATIYAGDTVDLEFTIIDTETGDPKNLSGSTVKWAMFNEYTGAVVLNKDTDEGIALTDAAGGIFTVTLLPADTENIRPDDYAHEAEVTDGGGNVSTVTVGHISLKASRI